MNKPKSIKELCEFIWYLEDKYDLLDFEIDGVKVWQSNRMRIYYSLAQKLEILEQPRPKLKWNTKILSILRFIKNSIKDNYFTLKPHDTLIFSHARSVKVNKHYIDPNTYYFIQELKGFKNIIEFESPYLGKHRKEREDHSHYIDWIILIQKILKLIYPHPKKDYELFFKIENEIKQNYKIDFNLVNLIKANLVEFKIAYKIYSKSLEKIKPNKIYVVVGYVLAPLIKAAKNKNIETIELQHGTFSLYHLGYSYPNRKQTLEYFPDKFYVWSDFWKKIIPFPIKKNKIIVDKFRHLEAEKLKFKQVKKINNQAVVISQGALGESIARKLLENYDMFKNFTIKYKLHPGEFDRWSQYPSLKKISEYPNVEIIKDEVHLYELFASSVVQVGVFSTALYEGLEFKCDTILLNLPGIEYMDSFIKNQNIKVI